MAKPSGNKPWAHHHYIFSGRVILIESMMKPVPVMKPVPSLDTSVISASSAAPVAPAAPAASAAVSAPAASAAVSAPAAPAGTSSISGGVGYIGDIGLVFASVERPGSHDPLHDNKEALPIVTRMYIPQLISHYPPTSFSRCLSFGSYHDREDTRLSSVWFSVSALPFRLWDS